MILKSIIAMFLAAAITIPLSAYSNDDTRTIVFEPPTERESGEPIDPATEIAQYNLYCLKVPVGNDPNDPVGGANEFKSSPPYVIPGLSLVTTHTTEAGNIFDGRGTHQCAMTALDTDGRESTISNIVTARWLSDPGAPSDVEIIVPNPISQLPRLTPEQRRELQAQRQEAQGRGPQERPQQRPN